MRILLTGGGTGGHIFPLFAVAKEIKDHQEVQNPLEQMEFLFIGPFNGLSKELFTVNNIQTKSVLTGKLRRYFSLRNFLDIFLLGIGIIQALWKVWFYMPDVIFSKGGYGSVPVVIAGWLYHIPIIIHDSDAVPGLANRFLSFFATRIAVSFEQAAKYFKEYKVAVLGNPVREDISMGSKDKAKEIFHITSDRPILLVMGGSQGAQKINDIILEALPQLLDHVEVIHQTGQKNYEYVQEKVQEKVFTPHIESSYHLTPFFKNELKDVLMAADLIVSRAGSNTLNEIAVVGKPSILIPLQHSASDHQRENAYVFAKDGASIIIEEPNLTPHLLLDKITELLRDKELLKTMGERAREIARPEAAKLIAQEVVKLGSR